MRTQINSDKLRALFEAHSENDEGAFSRAADAIISEELASNHHQSATELQHALRRNQNRMAEPLKPAEVRTIPKDRRNGDDLLLLQESSVTPDRVVLMPETKARIARVLDEHRQRHRLREYGCKPKTKLLFWGPPGTGKTVTASLLASELGLPIGVLRLSTVISSYLGDTAAHLQRVFIKASNTPMVLLLDEADAIGKNRDDPNDVGELKRVVNSLLQALDAFASADTLLIAASNHQYLLDPALWRRFDDVISFPLPGRAERERLLGILLNGVAFRGSSRVLAGQMRGLSFADIEHVAEEAVKTMLLTDRAELSSADVSIELHTWITAVRAAKRKPGERKR